MSDVSLSAQGFLSLASHNDLGVTLPAAAAGRMRSPENRPAPGEHLHVMPIMRGHFWYRKRILQNDLVENIGTIFRR